MNKENYTVFYTDDFEEKLIECEGIIYLNIGDKFVCKNGNLCQITYKLFNPKNKIMTFHSRIIAKST